MKNIKQGFIKGVELLTGDVETLLHLAGTKEFQRFRAIAETYLQKSGYDLLSYNFQSDEHLNRSVMEARGGFRFWRRMIESFDAAEKLLEEKKEKENEQKRKNDYLGNIETR